MNSVLLLAFLLLFCNFSPTESLSQSQPDRNMKIRVVSYNVLSSHLASPSHFCTLKPEHLDAKNRLPVVLSKLEKQMKESRSIICLQEVSYDWAGAFHTFFAKQGYHLVTGLYGKKFNGYMGVALAWPTDTLEAVDVDISRLADKRVGGWPAPDEKGFFSQAVDTILSPLNKPLKYLGLKKDVEDHWSISQRRFNVLLTATLRDKSSGKAFCIGNYHMPCCFYAPMVMTIHSEMAVKHVQDIATKQDAPYILTGDFNIKPADSSYRLITTGKIDTGDPCFPSPKNGYEWASTIDPPMRSAYAEALDGKEPDFTNYARIRENDPFIDTLDYIFLSPSWKVENVLSLPHRDEAGGPFPNLDKDEPSDHILIAADLGL